MNKANIQPFVAVAGILTVAVSMSVAGSQSGESFGGIRVFALCAIIAFAIQWLAFIPAYVAQTERFFDLTGSITYITVAAVGVVAVGNWEPRSLVIAALIFVWALRLGWFLFQRVRRSGGDRRFDSIKQSFPSFFLTWTVQGLWVLLTSAAGLAAITTAKPAALEWIAFVGIAVWAVGFAIEMVADAQKRAFRSDPANRGRFIRSGLWAWSRHPNYFGEIVIWVGIAIIAAPALSGWQWVTMVSPVFVFVLLTRVSGIPILERQATARWGDDQDYREYRTKTPVLVPRPPTKNAAGRHANGGS
jgi:steroid 5-alpha reductase family enzyme